MIGSIAHKPKKIQGAHTFQARRWTANDLELSKHLSVSFGITVPRRSNHIFQKVALWWGHNAYRTGVSPIAFALEGNLPSSFHDREEPSSSTRLN